ncbi:Cytochrome b5-like heme/steroid binding domain protein [Kalmanozyma brasiliensis GHG001]|uniref:Preprotein translocase subunit Sec66 n=1 Tax=Kalmanozyma brasiliensis (strain GHG001) TaxID=1365824 RepID=V5EBD0_KALBG|nr:Cytochrome b5-like heme/steroid binding domain protein [Kalmanozyma brasiliensis GHG001]EST07701.1 Cytochrome b5-like heme/steroid binding domain protein [Kalmanozyma brasiliensis GHG001]
MGKQIDANELKNHKSEESAWTVVEGKVYDVTKFLDDHPGGKKILLKNCGKDSTEAFWTYHSEKILEKVAAEYHIGEFKDSAKL